MNNYEKFYRRYMKRTRIIDTHWLWLGAKNSGHGIITVDGRCRYIHRFMFCLKNNLDYKDTFFTNHKIECSLKNCWNPDHLYQGSHSDNMNDAVVTKTHHETRKTHCPHGHEYTNYKSKNGKRVCLTCRRTRDRNRKRYTHNGKRYTIPGSRTL